MIFIKNIKKMPKRRRYLGLGKHTWVPPVLRRPLEDLFDQEGVDRILMCKRARIHKNRFPKGHLIYVSDIHSGIKIKGYASGCIHEIVVVVKPLEKRDEVRNYIAKKYR